MKARLEVLIWAQLLRVLYLPVMDKPVEEQKYDLTIGHYENACGHPEMLLGFELLEGTVIPYMEIYPVYQEMWKEMARTVSREAREPKVRALYQHMYELAYRIAIYSPLSLYAMNKEVNFVAQKISFLRLAETSVTDKHWSLKGQSE